MSDQSPFDPDSAATVSAELVMVNVPLVRGTAVALQFASEIALDARCEDGRARGLA